MAAFVALTLLAGCGPVHTMRGVYLTGIVYVEAVPVPEGGAALALEYDSQISRSETRRATEAVAVGADGSFRFSRGGMGNEMFLLIPGVLSTRHLRRDLTLAGTDLVVSDYADDGPPLFATLEEGDDGDLNVRQKFELVGGTPWRVTGRAIAVESTYARVTYELDLFVVRASVR